MPRTLFVSDVHLRPREPAANRDFLRFLEQPCDELYIVGDLFDYWIGPKQLQCGDYDPELAALREKSKSARLFFIKGNRDYLLDARFEKASGTRVLGDRARVQVGGKTVLLAHGDFVYNRNPKYAAYRTLMKSKPIEDLWLSLPAFVGRTVVRGYRKVSPMTTKAVTWSREEIVDRALPFFRQGADVLICGHIHQPQTVDVDVAGRPRRIFIMGDWCGGTQDYVSWDGDRFEMRPWPKGG
jgi:UDP-2,3-diacylglucosamine hydrolase